MDPQKSALGLALERYRPFLRALARNRFDSRLRGKFDPSDVVQDTFVRAVQALDEYHGSSDAELGAWLRQILVHTLANTIRDFSRDKRDVGRESAIEAGVEESLSRLAVWVATGSSSPSDRAAQNEDVLRLSNAIEALPEGQREALTLHHLQKWTLDAVAERMHRSTAAVAGLIKRAVRQLRLCLVECKPD